VPRRLSPNHDERPDPRDIALVVVHGISLPPGEFGGAYVDALFRCELDVDAHPSFADLRGVRVSPHLFIDRAGRVVQYVAFDRRAWHAGLSLWRGRVRCNDFSIGIELEGTDRDAYTDAQYAALVEVVAALLVSYPRLSLSTVVGHNEIAPGRKTDPGPAFDWPRFFGAMVHTTNVTRAQNRY
jgi:AmpD protein